MKKLYLIFFHLFFLSAFSQSNAIDSITNLLKTDKEDTNKVKHLNDLGLELMFQNTDTSILLSNQALELAITLAWDKGIAKSNSQLGIYYSIIGDYSFSLAYQYKALKIQEQLQDKKGIAAALNNIGNVYNDQGDYPRALEYYFKTLKLDEESENKNGIAGDLNNIGNVYINQGDYPKALEYYFKVMKLYEELENKYGLAGVFGNIGSAYNSQGDYPRALEYLFKALNLDEELGNKNGTAIDLYNIGNGYGHQGDYLKARECYFQALQLGEELRDKNGMAFYLGGIGYSYLKEENYKEAELYLLKTLEISTEIGELVMIKAGNEYLSDLYSQTNRYQLAYEHYKLYTAAKDSLFNEEKSKEMGRLEMKHEIEIAEMERERKAAEELKIKTQKTERRNLLEYSGMVIGLIIIGLFVTILGFVKVKPWVAEGITFFVFLLFFEFLLVLFDPYMDKFTHGEPAYKLFINAAVALCVFPIHAFFEKLLKKRLMKRK